MIDKEELYELMKNVMVSMKCIEMEMDVEKKQVSYNSYFNCPKCGAWLRYDDGQYERRFYHEYKGEKYCSKCWETYLKKMKELATPRIITKHVEKNSREESIEL